jgi:hypothetical protein
VSFAACASGKRSLLAAEDLFALLDRISISRKAANLLRSAFGILLSLFHFPGSSPDRKTSVSGQPR